MAPMKKGGAPLHGTHVWVRTDLVEAILDQGGSLPNGWRPRKRTRATDTEWGWCRASVHTASTTPVSTPLKGKGPDPCQSSLKSPYDIKLRKITNSPALSRPSPGGLSSRVGSPGAPDSTVSITLTVNDCDFAPPHLQNASVSFSYNTSDYTKVCTANAWWSQRESPEPPSDLTMLEQLHEPAVVFCLRHRYEAEHIYTYTGKILLALNPFQALSNLYGDDVMQQYWRQDYSERPPPHIYAIAEDAYRSMIRSNLNQSILVSGESGAGKTVTTKVVMRYLATLSQRTERNKQGEASRVSIESQVLQSNPILESFGNARTVRNDNSSRFGKFIEIRFDTRLGSLKSASIRTYLLEKVRLISQCPGERNYHVFYEILAALPQKDRKRLRIATATVESFRMTSESGTFDRRDGVSDRETYRELRSALDTVGFSADEQTNLFTVACALLHTSNLTFVPSDAEDSSALDRDNPSLRAALALLGVSVDALNGALCQVLMEVNSERLYKNLSIEKAHKAVEALMKATYGALFEYVVRRVNESIQAQQTPTSQSRNTPESASIGVLDIFGFESFEVNSFEQLCINHCNEALQQQFNRFVFKLEQQEYEREGIDWSFITFPDNQDVLDLIEKKRHGILSVLDEQCRLARCTDKSFALAVYEKCRDHPRFIVTKQQEAMFCFSIHHYAGIVEYDSSNFLEKNKDELPKETTELLLSSLNPFVASLGALLCEQQPLEQPQQKKPIPRSNPKQMQRGSSSLLRDGVGMQFSSQLTELRSRIESTEPHYVRCLKPNDDLVPNNFDPLIIADQLRCAGVLEAIRVSRVGFPHRYFHDHFVERYGLLRRKKLRRKGKHMPRYQDNDSCTDLVDELTPMLNEAMENDSFPSEKPQRTTFLGMQMGKTKVFLRLRAFETLERLRSQTLDRAAAKIQAFARMCFAQTEFEIAVYAATIIQKFVRKSYADRRFREQLVTSSAMILQNSYRCYRARTFLKAGYYIARWCQSAFRGTVARQLAAYLFLDRKANSIQKAWKIHNSSRAFKKLRKAVIYAQTRVRARAAHRELCRRRREAKDLNNVMAERDKYKEEMARLRKELEQEKEKSELSREEMKKEKASEVQNLRNEIQRLQHELTASYAKRSPTHSETENLKFLVEEVRIKEGQLETLRNELDCLRSATDSFSINSVTLEGLALRSVEDEQNVQPKKSSPVRSDVSLLDSMDEHQIRGIVDHITSPSNDQGQPNHGGISLPDDYVDEIRHLHNSIRQGNMHLFTRIMEQATDPCSLVNEGDRYGRTALHLAAISTNTDVTSMLVETGAVVNAQDEDGETPLHLSESSAVTEILLRKGGANPNIPNIDGITALHLAVQRRDVDAVRSLLRSGADVNNADNIRWFTALHLIALPARNEVAESRDFDVRQRITQLLAGSHGTVQPDLNDQDREGNTPLHYAVQIETSETCDIVAVLLERGADPNICNERNQGAIHLLCHNTSLRDQGVLQNTLRNMLNNGADANLQSLTGCTALHLSLYHQDTDSAVELVSKGAELHILWKKPKRWDSFWNDMGSSEVLALDMVESDESLHHILSAITTPHKWAPARSWCMHCKASIGATSRATHCRHCSRFVCGLCTSSCLPPEYFPKTFGVQEPAWVCVVCEKILLGRKDNSSSSTSPSSDEDDRFSS